MSVAGLNRSSSDASPVTAVDDELSELVQQVDKLKEAIAQCDEKCVKIEVKATQVEKEARALIKEAENMRLVAGAVGGFGAGLAAGVGLGVSGGSLALCGAGGSAVGITGAVAYNKYTQTKREG